MSTEYKTNSESFHSIGDSGNLVAKIKTKLSEDPDLARLSDQELGAFAVSLKEVFRTSYNSVKVPLEFATTDEYDQVMETAATAVHTALSNSRENDPAVRQKAAVEKAIEAITEKSTKINNVVIEDSNRGTVTDDLKGKFKAQPVRGLEQSAQVLADELGKEIETLLGKMTDVPEGLQEAVDQYKLNIKPFLEKSLITTKGEKLSATLRPYQITDIAKAALNSLEGSINADERGQHAQRTALNANLTAIIAQGNLKAGKTAVTAITQLSAENLQTARGAVNAPEGSTLKYGDQVREAILAEMDFMKLASAKGRRGNLVDSAKREVDAFLKKSLDPNFEFELPESAIPGIVAAIETNIVQQDLNKNAKPVFNKATDKGVIATKIIVEKSGLSEDDKKTTRANAVDEVVERIKGSQDARKAYGEALGKYSNEGDKARAAVESAFDKMKADSKGASTGKAGEKTGNAIGQFAMKNPKTSGLFGLVALVAGIKQLLSGGSWVSKLFGTALVAGGIYAGVKGYQGYQASRDGGNSRS